MHITGPVALYLGEADWHPLPPNPGSWHIAGLNYKGADCLGAEGIYNCGPELRRLGFDASDYVPCANVPRAFVDMVWSNIKSGRRPWFDFDTYLLDEEDVEEIVGLLGRIRPQLAPYEQKILEAWLGEALDAYRR